ncbi:hypothetical protein Trydic_g5982 [Trypoxylus dichotomus]
MDGTYVHDQQYSERPSVSGETIAKVKEAILKDRRIHELCEMIPDDSERGESCSRWDSGVAPNGDHLFPELNKHVGGTYFGTGEELKEEVLNYFCGAAGEFYDSSIKKMVHPMQRCIDFSGNYVEKLEKV